MQDTKYNGWTNYATWRVNLEIFDGIPPETFDLSKEAYDLGHDLSAYAEDLIEEIGGGSRNLAVDYAMAFLNDVNWHEIATNMKGCYAES